MLRTPIAHLLLAAFVIAVLAWLLATFASTFLAAVLVVLGAIYVLAMLLRGAP